MSYFHFNSTKWLMVNDNYQWKVTKGAIFEKVNEPNRKLKYLTALAIIFAKTLHTPNKLNTLC